MSNAEYISLLLETKQMIVSLIIMQLINQKQQSDVLLKSQEPGEDVAEETQEYIFNIEEQDKLNAIFLNILKMYSQSCYIGLAKDYLKELRNVLVSYNSFKKIQMPEQIAAQYNSIRSSSASNEEIGSVKNLLYV